MNNRLADVQPHMFVQLLTYCLTKQFLMSTHLFKPICFTMEGIYSIYCKIYCVIWKNDDGWEMKRHLNMLEDLNR